MNVATYEYGPFGEVIRMTGPMAKANPFRFSTKYQDDETDLLCYPFRFYNASTGRWLSRDPIGEDGGANLYEFADNAPVIYLDPFGLDGLTYNSDGEYYFNGHMGGYSSQGSASGKQDSSYAWFSQSATVNNCPGGLCNSGGTGSSSSFVTATVKNSGKCSLKVHCVCNISWSGSSTTIKYNTSGFTAKSTVLDKSFNHRFAAKGKGTGTPPVFSVSGSGADANQEDFTLAVGASKDLYNGYIAIAVGNVPGDSFSASMSGGCTCTAK